MRLSFQEFASLSLALEHAPKPKIIPGARNTATAAVPRIAGLRLSNNAWPMSAELVGSAHKIVHISPRVALPIDVQFLYRPRRRKAARVSHYCLFLAAAGGAGRTSAHGSDLFFSASGRPLIVDW